MFNDATPSSDGVDIAVIDTGSGITPVLSMLRSLVDERHIGLVTFVHYGFTADDVCYAILDLEDAVEMGILEVEEFERLINPDLLQ